MSAEGSCTLVSPPQSEPITVEEAKVHLRVEYDFTDDDAYIGALISAARRYTEEYTATLFMNQQWKMSFSYFPCQIIIPKRPVYTVDSIEYLDETGALQTLAPGKYKVNTDSWLTRIEPAYGESWPIVRYEANAVVVGFTAGFENMPGGIPEHLKQALLLLIGHYYENREDSVRGLSIQSLPRAYDVLVGIERVMGV